MAQSKLLKLWDTRTGEQLHSVKKHTDWITALDISPDGILLASGDRNGGVWVWEAETANEFHTLRAHQAGITALAFRSDSNLLGTASEDGTVRFWEMNNGGEVKKIDAHSGGVTAFAFAKNGTFVTAGRDKKAKLWKTDFNALREIELPALATAAAMDFENNTAFVADALGNIHAFSAEEKGTPDLATFPTNPPTIATRLQQIASSITGARKKLDSARAEVDGRNKSIQSAADALKAAEKKHAQAKQILQASEKGLAEATRLLEQLKAAPETPPADIEKASTSRQAAEKTRAAAQARIEPTRKEIDTARKAAEEARKADGGEGKDIDSALAEIEFLRAREKSWSAAAINTHALHAATEATALVQENDEKIEAFRQSLTQLDSPTTRLKGKRAQRNEFSEALGKTTLTGAHLEEAHATLQSLQASVKNHEDILHEKETELADFHGQIDAATQSLAEARSQSTLLRERYLQALK